MVSADGKMLEKMFWLRERKKHFLNEGNKKTQVILLHSLPIFDNAWSKIYF